MVLDQCQLGSSMSLLGGCLHLLVDRHINGGLGVRWEVNCC